MVYRVCVVDDESYIADSISMRLQSDFAQDMEISVYYSSRTALEAIRAARMDILIADIRMPELSGMELMEAVLKLWPKCRVILLTAHAQFDYVYRAIRHACVDYVLKQDGYSALYDTVERALERINMNNLREDQLRTARQQAKSALPWLEREFLMDLVHGARYDKNMLDRTKQQLALAVDVEAPAYMLMPVVHGAAQRETLIERTERTNALVLLAQDFLPEAARMLSVQVDESRLLWLWQFPVGQLRTTAQMESVMEGVQLSAHNQMDVSLSFAYCPGSGCWPEYPAMYSQLNTLFLRHAADDAQQWIDCADTCGDASMERQQAQTARVQQWSHAYKANDPRAVAELEQLLHTLCECSQLHDVGYMQLYLQIALPLAQMAQNMAFSRAQCEGLELAKLYDAKAHASPKEAAAYLRFVAGQLPALRRENADNSTKALIAHVQDYIQGHLGEDISLMKLAEYVHMNASYLSRVFKQRTGRNLKDYIWELRLNRACELLRRPDLRVHEVSEQLGFLTPSYFSYFFKRRTGLTPREYRDAAGK